MVLVKIQDEPRNSIDNTRELCIISPILYTFIRSLDELPQKTKLNYCLSYKSRRFVHVLVYSGLFAYGYHD